MVFSVNPGTGAETVLHSFGSYPDAAYPVGGLINVRGTLVGTSGGGTYGEGTVYLLNPDTGAEKVIYSFCRKLECADGSAPNAGLINVNGALYGTTSHGGAHGVGTVFSITR